MKVALEKRTKPTSWAAVKYIVFPEKREESVQYNCFAYIPKALDNRLKGDAKKREELKALYQTMLEKAGWKRSEFKQVFGGSYL